MDTWLSDTISKAEKKGKIELLVNMIKKGIISLKQAAEQLGMSVEKFEKEAKKFSIIITSLILYSQILVALDLMVFYYQKS